MAAQKLSEHRSKTRYGPPRLGIEHEKLHREYRSRLAHAFGFMTTAAIEIEKRNHHPEC